MNDILVVQVVDGEDKLNGIENNDLLLEFLFIFQYLVQLTALDERHHEVQPHVILEQEVHLNQERVLALEQDVLFAQRILYLVVLDQNIFSDRFNGVLCAIPCKLRQEYFAERATAYDCLDLKVIKCDILELVFAAN